MSRPRVLLADDHRIVSEGLKSLLDEDFELVGMVEDGRALVAAAKKLRPDVVVADITMPHLNGIDATVQLKRDDPNIKIVGTVYGMATASVTQSVVSNVLPSLPPITGVLGDGSFGVAQAFEQFGGRYSKQMPVISGDGDANFVHWWIEQKERSGYKTLSMNAAPSISEAALWVAIEIMNHRKVPKYMKMTASTVTNDTVEQYSGLKPGTAVASSYSADWVRRHLLSQKN